MNNIYHICIKTMSVKGGVVCSWGLWSEMNKYTFCFVNTWDRHRSFYIYILLARCCTASWVFPIVFFLHIYTTSEMLDSILGFPHRFPQWGLRMQTTMYKDYKWGLRMRTYHVHGPRMRTNMYKDYNVQGLRMRTNMYNAWRRTAQDCKKIPWWGPRDLWR
jgi:hypothetical protein